MFPLPRDWYRDSPASGPSLRVEYGGRAVAMPCHILLRTVLDATGGAVSIASVMDEGGVTVESFSASLEDVVLESASAAVVARAQGLIGRLDASLESARTALVASGDMQPVAPVAIAVVSAPRSGLSRFFAQVGRLTLRAVDAIYSTPLRAVAGTILCPAGVLFILSFLPGFLSSTLILLFIGASAVYAMKTLMALREEEESFLSFSEQIKKQLGE